MPVEVMNSRPKRRRIRRFRLPSINQTSLTHILLHETTPDLESVNPSTPSLSPTYDSDVDIVPSPTTLHSPITNYAPPRDKTMSKNQRIPRCPPRPNGPPRFKMDESMFVINPDTGDSRLVRNPAPLNAEWNRSALLDSAPMSTVLPNFSKAEDTAYEFVVLNDYFYLRITPENNIVPENDPDFPPSCRTLTRFRMD
ncbi:hypothetical protein D9613_009402 [Agrocybe pediades]|uniref:Uncharacterized protein n=1 Tax=Agrocybe pediades TaxID=84607 RepID=A0A8H4VTG4_9AGAR|nr:hypothetical protein D9613_009402 [Agrocybe pediades]